MDIEKREHRVLIAGDTHGSVRWIRTLMRLARRYGTGVIIVCGDFGFWPDAAGGVDLRFVRAVTSSARDFRVRVIAVDGNHDFHPGVRSAFAAGADGLRVLSDRLVWADRGARFSVSGTRFGALGGAVSTDRDSSTPGNVWWPTEMVTENDVAALGSDPLDVLICHDAPSGVQRGRAVPNVACSVRIDECRQNIRRAVDATKPSIVFHGHHHARFSDGIWTPGGGVQVEGLSANVNADGSAWGLLELADLSFRDGFTIRGA